VSDLIGWAAFVALSAAGLTAVAWTTFLAHRFGQGRLHLGDTALSFWTLAAFVGLFLGLWIPAIVFVGARSLLRTATRARA